ADVFILGFLKFLFPVCFFWRFSAFASIDYQHLTNFQQILKKKITMADAYVSFLAQQLGGCICS
ncbi:MAG: hypothetical protein KIG52_06960, partial [Muribaculaceae bacterium]|nr:hypothetical protein [Muribaculaceae bacterium]